MAAIGEPVPALADRVTCTPAAYGVEAQAAAAHWMDVTGATVSTFTVRVSEPVEWLSVSTATALKVWLPSATVAAFQLTPYGAVPSLPTTLPSIRKSTWSMPTALLASAARSVAPFVQAPSAGAVSVTPGGPATWIVLLFTASVLPALSIARNLTVVVPETVIGPV